MPYKFAFNASLMTMQAFMTAIESDNDAKHYLRFDVGTCVIRVQTMDNKNFRYRIMIASEFSDHLEHMKRIAINTLQNVEA